MQINFNARRLFEPETSACSSKQRPNYRTIQALFVLESRRTGTDTVLLLSTKYDVQPKLKMTLLYTKVSVEQLV